MANHRLDEGPIAFTRGIPPVEAFPSARLAACFETVLRDDANLVFQYGRPPGYLGYPTLRRALAEEYGTGEDQVLVGNGSLQLLDLLAAVLTPPGSTVLTEQPSYDRALTIFRRGGARVIGVPLEADGLSIERLRDAVTRWRPKLLYLVPDFQNPAGVTLSPGKRREVVELAIDSGLRVVEDIPYRKLRYQGAEPPLLRELNPGPVVTLGSFSKLLSPGIRVGFLIAEPALVATVAKQAEDTYLSPVIPTQAAVGEYLRRGWLADDVDRLRALYRPRWEAMVGAVGRSLASAHVMVPDGGFFVGLTLPDDAHTECLVARARRHGVLLCPGPPFFADPDEGGPIDGDRFVRLAFQAVGPEAIEEGVRRLADLL
jgi:2-aminoadipate transaminase